MLNGLRCELKTILADTQPLEAFLVPPRSPSRFQRRKFIKRDLSSVLHTAVGRISASCAFESLGPEDRAYLEHKGARHPAAKLRVRFHRPMTAQGVCNWWAHNGLPASALFALRRGADTVAYLLVDHSIVPLTQREAVIPREPKAYSLQPIVPKQSKRRQLTLVKVRSRRPVGSRQRVSQQHDRDRAWTGFRP
jgi:hypothetical protein